MILDEEYVGLRKSCELNLHPPHMIITYQHQELQVNFSSSLSVHEQFLKCSSIKNLNYSYIIFATKIGNIFCIQNMESLCKQQNITFHDANREDVSQRSLFSFHVLYMLLKLSWLCIKSFLWEKTFFSYLQRFSLDRSLEYLISTNASKLQISFS